MDEDYIKKCKIFVRVCLQYATFGVLHLNTEECLRLYVEAFIMADFLEDSDTMMLVCKELGLLFRKLQIYSKALKYQQLHLTLAVKNQNKAAQIEAYNNLGKSNVLIQNYEDALSCYEKAKDIAINTGNKNAEAGCYGNIGAVYHLLGNDNAITSFKQCLAVATEINNNNYQKIAYYNMAAVYMPRGDFQHVINCYEEWLKLAADEDEQMKAGVYEGLGIAYQNVGNSQQAIKCLEIKLDIAKKLQDKKMAQEAYKSLGNFNFSKAEFHKAIGQYENELKLAIELEDRNSQGTAYCDLSVVYESLGNYAMAIELNEKALAIGIDVCDKNIEASANGNLGNVYLKEGYYHKAIDYHERQLQICTDIGLKKGQARACSSLGIDHKSLGNFYEAVKYQTKSLNLCIEIEDKMGEEDAHGNLGTIYDLLGQYNKAIFHSKKCLEIARQIQDRCCEGRATGNLGTSLMKMDNSEEAVPYFEDCLKIAQEVNDKQNEGKACGYLGKCKANLGQYHEAMKMADKQIDLAEEIGDKEMQGSGNCKKGELHRLLNDYQQAINCFQKAFTIAKDIDNKRLEADSLRNLGRLYGILPLLDEDCQGVQENKEKCFSKAIHYLRESLRCSELLFDNLQEQDHLKISILETFIKDYNFLATVLLFNNDPKEALAISERGRARALNDLLISKYHLNKEKISEQDPLSFTEIESMECDYSIIFYSHQPTLQCAWVITLVESPFLCVNDEAGLSDIVDDAYKTLQVREVQCEDRSVQTDETQQNQKISKSQKFRALDANEKLLFSSYKKNKLRCIVEEDLYDNENPKPLEGLYKTLISPVLHLLTKDEIVIIPDGAVFTVPFAALRDPNTGQHLSQTKRIRLAPSLTSLKVLQESPEEFHSQVGALIIGNPSVGKVLFKGKTKTISNLPFAEKEAKLIGKLLGVEPFIGAQATKEKIKENLRKGVAVIHFAAHGTTDGEIFLTPPKTDDLSSEENYILTMKEVQESGVRPKLVVLSCCHSGRGEIKAEGVVGMSRAFLAAGARAVVASLWAIADEATMVFMESFYTHLKHGESASHNLQAAMKDMREIPRYSAPQFWAPFFLIGDDVTITF